MHETSMNFDMEGVRPFLERLNVRLSLDLGVDELAEATGSTPVGEEFRKTIVVSFDGEAHPLDYQVFMDDVDAPDLYFFADSKELIDAIDGQLKEFAEEQFGA
jgi:hypothetical protein